MKRPEYNVALIDGVKPGHFWLEAPRAYIGFAPKNAWSAQKTVRDRILSYGLPTPPDHMSTILGGTGDWAHHTLECSPTLNDAGVINLRWFKGVAQPESCLIRLQADPVSWIQRYLGTL